MSEGTRYVVELEMKKLGDFGIDSAIKKVPAFDKALDRLKNRFDTSRSMAADIGNAFDTAAGHAMSLAKWTAVAAGTAMFAGATYGVLGLNAELQKTEVSLGTMFSAQGFAKDVPAGIEQSKGVIAEMRRDAQKLPGEFSDLLNIFRTGGIPAFRSGLDVKGWEKLSSKVMAASVVSSLPMDQAAREFAQLLEGRSGAHNVFGMRLLGLSGDKAQEFNKKSGDERLKILSAELDKYSGAIDSFSKTYDAASSTFIDTLKLYGQKATEPLFQRVTGTLNDLNDWVSSHQAHLGVMADRIGERLVRVFDWGREKLLEWGPLIYDFGDNLFHKVGDIWTTIQPAVTKFAETLKDALKDPGTIDRLMTLGKLYIGLKLAGAVGGGLLGTAADVGRVVSLVKDVSGAVTAMRAAGGLAGLLATGGAGAAAAGAGAGGAAAGAGVGLGLGGGMVGLATGGLGLLLAAGVAGWAYTIANATDTLRDFSMYMDADNKARHEFVQQAYAADMQSVANAFDMNLLTGLESFSGTLHQLTLAGDTYSRETLLRQIREQAQSDALYGTIQDLAVEQEGLIDASNLAAAALYDLRMAALTADVGLGNAKYDAAMEEHYTSNINDVARVAAYNAAHGTYGATVPDSAKAKKPETKHGHGGTHIQKVEIVVTTNRDPSRVALVVRDNLMKLARNPTASRYVPNYSKP